jgi:hypothetical protein
MAGHETVTELSALLTSLLRMLRLHCSQLPLTSYASATVSLWKSPRADGLCPQKTLQNGGPMFGRFNPQSY